MTQQKQQRVLKYGMNSALAVVIVAGILVSFNVIGSRLFTRVDLTEGKEFTISPSTKKIVRGLDDLISVKVFFSKKLPPQLATLTQQVGDLLKEYQVYSGGKVQVRFFDPTENEDLQGQAQSMGIPQLQMNVLERDQYQVTNVFMGIGIQYGDKTQAIPVVEDASSLEYDLTSAIIKLTSEKERSLGFLTGHQERDLATEYEGIKQTLEQEYQIRPVNLASGNTAVPEDLDALVIAGSRNISEREKYEIDQYIMRGGKVFFFLDPISMNEQMGLQAFPLRSGLEDLLEHYGVQLKQAIALDLRNSQASFSMGYIAYTTPYPPWPRIVQDGLSPTHPITSRLESMTLPWTAPLELKVPEATEATKGSESAAVEPAPGTNQPYVKAVVLAKTTDRAWTQTGRYDLNPQAMRGPQGPGQVYPLAVALSGRFQSFYSGKTPPPKPADAPPRTEGEETAETPPPQPAVSPTETPIAESPETQVLLVGNSQFLTNQFLRMFPENVLFIQNGADWVTLGEELIAIRSRGATERPVKELSPGSKSLVKYLNTFGVAALVILFGLIRNVVRRRTRERLALSFRGAA